MKTSNVLAGLAVRNIEAATKWYTRLLDRGPDMRLMPELAEWEFEDGGWLQVFEDGVRSGRGSVTLVTPDVAGCVESLREKGIRIRETSKSEHVEIAVVEDPDGNQIVFAEARAKENRSAQVGARGYLAQPDHGVR